ncbi:AraC family transcriptional regulator [Halalkalibacter alkalisediminis]|uniref:AraC family transcriptional regulator N-terminal domain-containing protein n=1 Tax=Halalkalibacter alkalisediminis TaxID=935616 RepID=A0ABV6NL56_9BACI|nr:AraC family transcriptional regulator [Halalkalibacter alkalisediminis]
MFERINEQPHKLTKLIERYSRQDSVELTTIPSLFFINESNVTEPLHGVYKPSFCVIVQGEKEVFLAQQRYTYGPGDYLVASVNLPVTGQVIKACSEAPYLALKLEFTPSQILEVLSASDIQEEPRKLSKRAMFVSKIETSLLDAVVRLVSLLDNPKDIPVLAPIFTKEILYRVLQGPHGDALKQMAIEGSNAYRIRDMIEQITANYTRPFRIEELAEKANMSVASLHRHFKDITAMTPIQFQKQLRLQEARRLLLTEPTDAADVAFRVGYESPSQFSREYSRMFGFPPREDINRLRGKYDHKIKV